MTTVVLTGAGGFLGGHVLDSVLKQTDWRVLCLDSFRHNGVTDGLAKISENYRDRIEVITHDLVAPFSTAQYIKIAGFDYLINIASRSQVDESILDPQGFILNNIGSTLTALELARQFRPSRVVHISTDEVYGSGEPATATDHNPSSPYSASKAMQEDACCAYRQTYGMPITIINSCNIFGERQSQLAFIPRILRAILLSQEIQVHAHQGRVGSRNYTYAGNVADRIVDELLQEHSLDRIWLSGQREIDNLSLVKLIADQMNRPVAHRLVEIGLQRPGYDLRYANLPNELWYPQVTFEEGIQRTVDWALNNPEWLGINGHTKNVG